jgi:hypothetical protein
MTYPERLVTSLCSVDAAGRRIKRHHINTEKEPINADIERAALGVLPRPADLDAHPADPMVIGPGR